MNAKPLYVDGRLYLTLEVVADMYQLRAAWLHEAYEFGLLGVCVVHDARLCLASTDLDRVATLVRLHRGLELDLPMIALMLDPWEPSPP